MTPELPKTDSNAGNRRDFLFGRSAVKALQEVAKHGVEREGLSPDGFFEPQEFDQLNSRRSKYWEQYSKRAMACDFEVLLNFGQYAHSASTVAEAFQLIDDLEDQLTVYRSHSEVSLINRLAGQESVQVQLNLFALLETAIDLYRQTNGAFDITSAGLTKLWKFDQRAAALPELAAIEEMLRNTGSCDIELDAQLKTIRFANPGIQINLGGIGKGYAIDQAAEQLRRNNISNFAIHGGQSSVKAHGSGGSGVMPEEPKIPGWWIGISHPILPGVRLGEIHIHDQAMGTSGTLRQGIFHRGVRYGHILDPRTGWPTSHFLSTTVITDLAAHADALATAFFVMTLEQVCQFCAEHPNVKAILVSDPDATERSKDWTDFDGQILLQTINFDEQDLRLETQV